ncbi:hypothetical protein C8Q77DRAFT_1131666 [Trametes polyzona]|nr:hypothetical protein C8Q77DRAFT_1131666 [Trametes polyzona]
MSAQPPPSTARAVPPTSGASAVANQNVERLKAAVKAIETLKQDLRDVRKEAKVREDILYSKTKLVEAELVALKSRMKYIEKLVGFPQSDDEDTAEVESGDADGRESERGGGDIANGDRAADGLQRGNQQVLPSAEEIAKSRYWEDKKEIKDVVALALKKLMNISALDAKNLPPYPTRDEEWPEHPQVRGERVLRFDWDQTEDDERNATALETARKWIRVNGVVELPSAALALREIFDSDLLRRMVKKFLYMRGEFRKLQRVRRGGTGRAATAALPENGWGEDDGFGGEGREGREGTSGGDEVGANGAADTVDAKAIFRSRAESKLAQRIRKRPGTQWENSKYDAAFTINAMSDDEDDPALVVGEAQRYCSRRPWYRSNIHQQIYAEIDARPDPDPDAARKMTARVPGPVKEGVEPPRARLVKNAHRIWMIKPEALEENAHWTRSGRVVANGRAWGDAEDPVDVKGKGKEKGTGPIKFRRMEETPDIKAARARLASLIEGRDVDHMFGGV